MSAMIFCHGCQRDLSEDYFYKKKVKTSGRQTQCIDCKKVRSQRYYLDNKALYRKRSTESRRRQQSIFLELKAKPCTDCGKTFPPCCMDWDHVLPGKSDNVSRFIRNGKFKQALQEIQLCELVCANCHRLRTWNRTK